MSLVAMVLATMLAVPCAPGGRPIVAEVLYDVAGDDTGFEFVELYNPEGLARSLAGLRLEAGDGSAPGRWTLKWTGGAADSIPARGRFVIGGAGVVPAPNALATLELQNGPDAIRLVWPDGPVETVGYGAHEFAEYACGDPTPDAPSGLALARVPDAAALGSNALDFRVAPPTPGRANQPERNAALVAGSLRLDPEQPSTTDRARLWATVANRGADSLAAGTLTLDVGEGWTPIAHVAVDRMLAPDDTATIALELPPLPAGKIVLIATARLVGDGEPADDRDSLRVRCGPGPLAVSEIQFHPAAGEGEWVEVWNRSGHPAAIAGFRLADRLDRPGVPAGGLDPLLPESLAVLAQDRASLLTRFPALDAGRVWEVSPWPSLNNSDDSSGVADVLILRELDGTLCERRPYSASGVPAGVPLERRGDGALWPAAERGGTPLAFPPPLAPLAGRLDVAPRRWLPGRPARLEWALPWDPGRVTIELYDLAGRRVTGVLADLAVSGRGGMSWQPPGLPGGLYLVVLRATDAKREQRVVATAPVRVEAP